MIFFTSQYDFGPLPLVFGHLGMAHCRFNGLSLLFIAGNGNKNFIWSPTAGPSKEQQQQQAQAAAVPMGVMDWGPRVPKVANKYLWGRARSMEGALEP